MSLTRDARALRQVAEIEAHAVAIAVLERNAFGPGRVVAHVAQRVHVRADVIAEHDQVAARSASPRRTSPRRCARRTAVHVSYIASDGRTTRGNATMSLCTGMLDRSVAGSCRMAIRRESVPICYCVAVIPPSRYSVCPVMKSEAGRRRRARRRDVARSRRCVPAECARRRSGRTPDRPATCATCAVRMNVGATTLTLIRCSRPFGRELPAQCREPAFGRAVGGKAAAAQRELRPRTEPMNSTLPPSPARIMCRAAACAWNIALFRFVQHHVVEVRFGDLVRLLFPLPPTQLTRMSRRPKCAATVVDHALRVRDRSRVEHGGAARPRRPCAAPRRRRSAFSSLCPAIATFAPAATIARQTASPMPPYPPVTSATLPSSRKRPGAMAITPAAPPGAPESCRPATSCFGFIASSPSAIARANRGSLMFMSIT